MGPKRIKASNADTREAILDATEHIMRREGYASVSSRRVAEQAGLKSQLVHYHFGTMDDLFQAVFQRMASTYFERHLAAMAAEDPLRALWAVMIDRRDMELIGEFMALSNHRKAIRQEIVGANQRTRAMQVSMLSRALEQRGISPERCPPQALAVLMSGAALALATEGAIGNSAAHADTLRFVDRLLDEALAPPAKTKSAGTRKPATPRRAATASRRGATRKA